MNPLNRASLEASRRLAEAGIPIPIGHGKFAYVDREDVEKTLELAWHHVRRKGQHVDYAEATIRVDGKAHTLPMHRFILGLKTGDGKIVDHRDGDGLNNRKSNLRVTTISINGIKRRKQSNNTSGFRGVSWHIRDLRWVARIKVNGVLKNLGHSDTAEGAARLYDMAALKYFGSEAVLNF